MDVRLSTWGAHASHADVELMVGLAARLRALQARGADIPVCLPADHTELLARVGLPRVAVGVNMMPAMPAAGWQ